VHRTSVVTVLALKVSQEGETSKGMNECLLRGSSSYGAHSGPTKVVVEFGECTMHGKWFRRFKLFKK